MELIDTHCHLNTRQFSTDLELVVEQSLQEGITKIVVPGTDIPSSLLAIQLAEKYSHLFASVGVHPNDGLSWNTNSRNTLLEMASHPKVVAIGEIGLDYYWNDCSVTVQKNILEEQLSIANEKKLPVILHSRESLLDLIKIIEEWVSNKSKDDQNSIYGVFHAFEGNSEQGTLTANLGMMIGIGGPVTYKNAAEKRELALRLDIDHIVLETDAPYLTPHPYRGKRNHPKFINLIAEKIAQIRNIQIKLIAQATTNNANRLFAWET